MIRINWLALIVSLVVFSEKVNSQTSELEFTEYTVIDGVRLGKINSIAQDTNGFLWLSDQGNRALLRYDGQHIKKYQYDPSEPNNPDKLGGYYPECFFIEESGVMWIGFYGQGLDRFDPNTNKFNHFDNDPENPQSLSNDFVTAVQEDNEGNLWIATYSGIDRLDRRTGIFTHYQYEAGNPNSLSCDTVRTLYLDKQGTLWAGTGLAWDLESDRGGLNRYNPKTDDFTVFRHNPDDDRSLINNKVRSIFEDSQGTFWIGTGGSGLHTMDRKSGAFTRHVYDPDNPEKLSRPPLGNQNDRITFIREDPEGYIWIGTDANGINRYNPKTKRVDHITNYFRYGAWWMHVAHDDQVWITTNRAQLIRINLHKLSVESVGERLNCIVEESPEINWIGTHKGLYKQNKQTGEKTYLKPPGEPGRLLNDEVISYMLMDSKGILWVGTWEGLFRIDPKTSEVKHYPNFREGTDYFSNNVTSILEGDDNIIWIGTDQGIERFDPQEETFTNTSPDFSNSNSLNGFVIADLEWDAENSLWVAMAANRGLNRWNLDSGVFDLFLHGLNVFELYTDVNGVLWVATEGGGLFQYDKEKDQFIGSDITEEAVSIFEDQSSNIWISTMEGVYKLDSNREHFSFFESKVEALNEGIFENVGVAYFKNGKINLGHWEGYYVYDPTALVEQADSTQVFVSEIRTIDDSDETSSLYTFAPAINSIILDQEQNSFSLNFIETDFQENVDNNIYYKLENYDADWRSTLPAEWISYYRVPTGNYRLLLKASSKSGVWAENKFFINISPPWWLTPIAYAGYGFIFIFGVYFVHRIQKRNTIRRERERIKDRELEQARKIEQAYEELKATQEQLVQSEKMASLGELTAGIAHEIQNPLNFVNNFSEVNAELVEELKEEFNSGNRDEVLAIIKDLAENEMKINFHGKRAEGIVKGMLQHSRSSNGQKDLVDINILADEYLRLSYHGLRAKDKSFVADYKADLAENLPEVNVIPQDIGRVLLNLINNAFYAVHKKAQEGTSGYKPLVTVKTSLVGDKVEIKVSDNGPGIPDEIKSKIFQPFFTTKPAGEGTGLGLSLSYDIVKAHRGELIVVSKEGEGTEFKITLNAR